MDIFKHYSEILQRIIETNLTRRTEVAGKRRDMGDYMFMQEFGTVTFRIGRCVGATTFAMTSKYERPLIVTQDVTTANHLAEEVAHLKLSVPVHTGCQNYTGRRLAPYAPLTIFVNDSRAFTRSQLRQLYSRYTTGEDFQIFILL